MRTIIGSILLMLLGLGCLCGQSYTSYRVGSATDTIVVPLSGVCLMGGATEDDNAMRWFLQQANGGDVLVLRASGADGYNDYFYNQLGVPVHSVETIICHSRLASADPYVLNRVQEAEAIWFAGGNQYNYVQFWRGTALDSLINHKIQHASLVIGGTSAGMAILGQAYFSAQNGTLTSAQALADPYHPNLTVDTMAFISIPPLQQVITDTHYDNPDRKARHMVFIARLLKDFGWNKPKGIACDEYTAVCIDSALNVKVFGSSNYDDYAYFLQVNCEVTANLPEVCQPMLPFEWSQAQQALKVCRIKGIEQPNTSFNLNTWESDTSASWFHFFVIQGQFFESPALAPICSLTTPKNPTSTLETLRFTSDAELFYLQMPYPQSIRLFNLFGQELTYVIISQDKQHLYIPKSMLPEGVYFLQTPTKTYKFVR